MSGYQNPFMGGQPQMGQQGQQGAPPPRQGPPQMGPGMGGAPPQQGGDLGFDQNHPAYLRFLSGPGGQRMQRGQQKDKYQGAIDGLMQQLQFAQIQGANPMVLADLQMQLQQAQRAFGEWQNEQYATQMGQMSRPGAPAVGGGPGAPSQLQQNPYLQMLLLGSLGMGGGSGPQMG